MDSNYEGSIAEESQTEIINSLAAYQKAVDKAAIVSITNARGQIIFANDKFCEISKYTREELLGRDHRIINSGFHSKEFFGEMWEEISLGHVWHGEIRNKAKDGSFYWVDTTISPILNENGHVMQYLSIRTLISERKTLEEEREKLMADLLEKYNDLMQFNYIVSHNLRNPVSNIIGLTGLLSDDCKDCDENIKEMIDHIGQSAEHMLEVIIDLNSILALNKKEGKKKEEANLLDIIASAQKSLEQEIRQSMAIIEMVVHECDYICYTVKTYMHSIFFNLISNAIKYKRGDLSPLIIIDVKRSANDFEITVSDNGTGIDLQKAGKDLFKPYKRFSTAPNGKGLGLYMTKTQVEALGGSINIKSQPGKGACFTIKIPA